MIFFHYGGAKMKRILTTCPYCHGKLKITALQCPSCDIEIKKDFEISPFDQLADEEYQFLLLFLERRGNLKEVQEEMKISYPTAKKKLDDVLIRLNLMKESVDIKKENIPFS